MHLTALIRTVTGRDVDLLDPQPQAIAIEDIAHGLAHTCRFSGQSARFYSVAEHAIRVSHMVPARDALVALLHDASEAYLSDLVSPLKALGDLAGYRAIESRLMQAIYRRFCPSWPPPAGWTLGESLGLLDLPESVQRADHELVELEMAVLFDGLDVVDLACHAPVVAKRLFLARFDELVVEVAQQPHTLALLTPAGAATRLHYVQEEPALGSVWLDTDIGQQDGLTIGIGQTPREALMDARDELHARVADLDRWLLVDTPVTADKKIGL